MYVFKQIFQKLKLIKLTVIHLDDQQTGNRHTEKLKQDLWPQQARDFRRSLTLPTRCTSSIEKTQPTKFI